MTRLQLEKLLIEKDKLLIEKDEQVKTLRKEKGKQAEKLLVEKVKQLEDRNKTMEVKTLSLTMCQLNPLSYFPSPPPTANTTTGT